MKDHLGNIRTVLTDEQKVDTYPAATMELAHAAIDTALFSNIATTRSDLPPGYPTDTTYTNPNNKVSKLDGSNNKIGPGITLKVMAGDKFNIRVSSWYRKNNVTPNTPNNPINDLLAVLANGVIGAATTAHGAVAATDLQNSGLLTPGMTGFLNNHTYNASKPKAYLNWVVLDEHFKYDSAISGFEQVGDDTILTIHTRTDLTVGKNGYLYVYVSNVTGNIPVYFDSLQVTHTRGPLLEEDHYYPFGLQMKGICSKAAGGVENKFKFNGGVELDGDFEVDIYETFFRGYDAQIGRFRSVDPKAESLPSLTPFRFGLNNPIIYNDVLGDLEGFALDLWNDLLDHVNLGGNIQDIDMNGMSANSFSFGSGGGDGGWHANISFDVFDKDTKIGILDISYKPNNLIEGVTGVLMQAGFLSCEGGPQQQDLNWVQVVITNNVDHPERGQKNDMPFIDQSDNAREADEPLNALTTLEINKIKQDDPTGLGQYTSAFNDRVQRLEDISTTWNATLSLVNIATSQVYISIGYGFSSGTGGQYNPSYPTLLPTLNYNYFNGIKK